jgi:hypothetical protein
MKYIFTKKVEDKNAQDGFRLEVLEATPERFVWGVVYKDGTELKQFGDDGKFHQFQEIKQEEVAMFVMYRFSNPNIRIDMPVENKQIFHFYRNLILSAATEEERRVKVYVFGYKDGQHTSYHYILPDDRLVIADKDIDISKFGI